MPATLQTANNITKQVFAPTIVETMDDEAIFSKRIEKTSDGVESKVSGKWVEFPLHVRRNSGIGYRHENERLQRAGQQGYVQVRTPLRSGYARVHITGHAMDLVDKDYNSWASAMEEETSRQKDDIAKDRNRIMYGDGRGVMATVADTDANTNEITVTNAQYLEEGFQVDIVDPATGAVAHSNVQILAVEPDDDVVIVSDELATVTEGHVIVRQGNWLREPQGLESIINDSGVLFDLSADEIRQWRSVVDDNGGTARPLSEGLMIRMCDKIRRRGGGKPTAIFCDLGSRRAYHALLTQQRRFNDPKEYKGGLLGLSFMYGGKDIPVVEENDAPYRKQDGTEVGTMWFTNEEKFSIYRDEDWHFIDRDGSIWKWVTDFDAYEAILKCYWELGVKSRHNHGRLNDIQAG